MNKLDVSKIVQQPLKSDQFFSDKVSKKQIYIHHTVSSKNAANVIHGWNSNSERVGTAFIISDDKIIQCYSSGQWAHHLGTKVAANLSLNKSSVAIEICNWGGIEKGGYTKNKVFVKKDPSKFYSYTGFEILPENVVDYREKWHGYRYFEKYTDVQIELLRQLLIYLCDTYSIPKDYNHDIWELCDRALSGAPGIFTHVSVRKDKSDCHPQPELIAMLKNLSKKDSQTIDSKK